MKKEYTNKESLEFWMKELEKLDTAFKYVEVKVNVPLVKNFLLDMLEREARKINYKMEYHRKEIRKKAQ